MKSSDMINVRTANISDVDFIVEGIIEAEKGGESIIPIQAIFNLTLEELKTHLKNFLLEDIIDCEYSLPAYKICEYNGERAGCLSSWIEGENGLESALIKMNCWLTVLPRERINETIENLKKVNNCNIERKKNYLQIEYLYIRKEFRKKGLHKHILIHCVNEVLDKPELQGWQFFLFQENTLSYNFFLNRGLTIRESLSIPDELVGVFFGHKTKLSLELAKSEMSSFVNKLLLEV